MTKLLQQSILVLILLTAVSLRSTIYAAEPTLGSEAVAKVDLQIQTVLQHRSSQTVDVIIRKTSVNVQLDAVIAQLGGRVTQDLPIIDSVAATIPGDAIWLLAKHSGVRYIALDGMVESTAVQSQPTQPTPIQVDRGGVQQGLCAQVDTTARNKPFSHCQTELNQGPTTMSAQGTSSYVLELFETAGLNNNDGTANWNGSWVETGEFEQSLASDDIMVVVDLGRNSLRVRDDSNSIERQVNLSGATNATLSFLYSRYSLDSSSEYVAVDVSANGGSSWTELVRYQGAGSDSTYYSASFDISAYATGQTAVRFRSPAGTMADGDMVFFDDVKIEYTTPGSNGSNNGNGSTTITSIHTGKCADVSGGSLTDWSNVLQWPCIGNANQSWTLTPSSGAYQIQAVHSGKCMDVASGSTASGAEIVQ
ncbi:MAG: RICIN domain-containing protein, partial [Anaerolineales bacterium]|nr:RICIN domain-containing protein [Anaerolineales bacterium]